MVGKYGNYNSRPSSSAILREICQYNRSFRIIRTPVLVCHSFGAVRFVILTALTIFRDVATCSLVEVADVFEELTASIFRVLRASEASS